VLVALVVVPRALVATVVVDTALLVALVVVAGAAGVVGVAEVGAAGVVGAAAVVEALVRVVAVWPVDVLSALPVAGGRVISAATRIASPAEVVTADSAKAVADRTGVDPDAPVLAAVVVQSLPAMVGARPVVLSPAMEGVAGSGRPASDATVRSAPALGGGLSSGTRTPSDRLRTRVTTASAPIPAAIRNVHATTGARTCRAS
jgi:hypothetical protein